MKTQFQVPEDSAYLLAHSVGCLPCSAREAVNRAYFQPWAEAGGDAWPHWLAAIGEFRAALVTLFGGRAEEWCPQPGVSAAISRILTGVRFPAHRKVVLAARDTFPSVGYALEALARLGLHLEFLDGDPGGLSTWRRIEDADVAAVVMMHVHSNTGVVTPIAGLAALAREHGVFSIADIAQSGGVLPLSVEQWATDAVVGTSVKWLCGGPGACFAWLNPRVVSEVEPIERGWFSHADPFEMDIDRFAFAPDARRLWGGTPSVAPFVIATAGLRTIAQVGVEAIRAHNLRLSADLLARVAKRVPPQPPLEAMGATLCLALGQQVEAALQAGGVRFDRRGERLRFSFGLWNDEDDVDRVVRCLAAA